VYVYVVDPQVSWFGFATFVKIPLYLHLFVVVLPFLHVVAVLVNAKMELKTHTGSG